MGSAPDSGIQRAGAPLAGRSVLVTRTREQATALVEPLESLGAEVLCFPVIEVVDPEDTTPISRAIERLSEYHWLIITSANGVDRFFDRLTASSGDASLPPGVSVAAVGSATAARLRERGIEPDFIPRDFRAEGIVDGFRELGIGAGLRILVPRAENAREVLPVQLRDMGADVDVVVTYRLVPSKPVPEVLDRLVAGTIDIATFASGGTFRHFLEAVSAAGLDAERVTRAMALASIGPVTTAAIRQHGFEIAVEAQESTMPSFVDAIVKRFGTSA